MTPPPENPGPGYQSPGFQACYRHADRKTGISCQRCQKPICGECMRPASVGFQCPSCVGRGRGTQRQPRTAFGAALTSGTAPITKVLMITIGALYLLNFISRGLVQNFLVLANSYIYAGEFWRLLTFGFVSYGLLQAAMTVLVLWMAGRALESMLGGWRFVALFVLSGFGGATLLFVLGPPNLVAAGSSAAVLGLLAANGIIKLKRNESIRGDIGLLILLVLASFVMSFASYVWIGQVGGILVGALTGFVLAYAPRERRTTLQIAGLVAVAVLCVVAIGVKLFV